MYFLFVEHLAVDIDLFNRIRRDDRLALNTLFAKYYQALCSFAHTYLKNQEEVEEVVADVFFNLWNRRHHLKIESNLRAYLYVAVKNASLGTLKARQSDVVYIEEILFDKEPTAYSTPADSFEFNELESHFESAINTLPPRCKQVFLLKWKDDLSYREISEILGITEKTVENHLVQAMLKIKSFVQLYLSADRHNIPSLTID